MRFSNLYVHEVEMDVRLQHCSVAFLVSGSEKSAKLFARGILTFSEYVEWIAYDLIAS